MPTFKQQQEKLTSAQHQLAVWDAIYKFLDDNFIARNGSTPKKAIVCNDCLVQVVPEDTLEEILKNIAQEYLKPLQTTIDSINSQEITILDKDDN